MRRRTRPPGAGGSSSPSAALKGYEYQFYWSARRALRLLIPGTNLRCVVVEGVHVPDRTNKPSDFYGVDLSEYYETTSGAGAEQIVLWQMKYGEQRADVPWTIARLCLGEKGDPARSVLGRLGASFAALRKRSAVRAPRDIRIRIASNRPLHPSAAILVRKLGEAAKALRKQGKKWLPRDLGRLGLTQREQQDCRRILSAIRLRGEQRLAFLESIDTGYFGGPEYSELEADLRSDMERFVDCEEDEKIRLLVERIRKAAQDLNPAQLEEATVLATLGSSKKALLPASPRIEAPGHYVETGQSSELASRITDVGGGKYLVHGIAGVGKSVVLVNLENHLPSGSKVVVYDCFGGGRTCTPDEWRFEDKTALTQIINEMALELGFDWLFLPETFDRHKTWARLKDALQLASKKMSERGGLLVIAIDAADNAVSAHQAAPGNKENCFIPNLWHIVLPERVALVLSCRTARRDLVLPNTSSGLNLEDVPVRPFEAEHSAEHLRHALSQLSEEACRRFHSKSVGNPRLQFYWIDKLRRMGAEEAEEDIRRRRRFDLIQHYRDWLDTASGSVENAKGQLPFAIMELQRPVHADALSGALDCEEGEARQVLDGLQPGLIFDAESSGLEFRDEDFEDFMRGQGEEASTRIKTAVRERLADYCLHAMRTNHYAARWGHVHLHRAERFDELFRIASDDSGFDALDLHEHPACRIDRCALALPVAAKRGEYQAAGKMLFQATKELHRRTLLSDLLIKSPRLAIAHWRQSALLREVEQWQLPREDRQVLWEKRLEVFRVATELAPHQKFRDEANRLLETGHLWLVQALDLSKSKRPRIGQPTVEEVAQRAAAMYLLREASEGAEAVLRCRPDSDRCQIAFDAWHALTEIQLLEDKGLTPRSLEKDLLAEAAGWGGVYVAGGSVDSKRVKKLSCLVKESLAERQDGKSIGDWVIDFAEAAAACGADQDDLVGILNAYAPERPFVSMRFPDASDDWGKTYRDAFRWHVLRVPPDAKNGADLFAGAVLPEKLPHVSEQEHEKACAFVRKRLDALLPIYRLRAKAIRQGKPWGSFERDLEQCWTVYKSGLAQYWDNRDSFAALRPVFLRGAVEALVASGADWPSCLEDLLFPKEEKNSRLLLQSGKHLVKALVRNRDTYGNKAEQVLLACATALNEETCFAREKIDDLVWVAEIALRIDVGLSKDLYQRAVEISEQPDWIDVRKQESLSTGCCRATYAIEAEPYRRRLAEALLGAQEKLEPCVARHKHLPWAEVLGAAATLDLDSAFRALIHWERIGVLGLSTGVSDLLWGLHEGPRLAPVLRLSLAELADEDSEHLLDPLSDLTTSEPELASKIFDEVAVHATYTSPSFARGEIASNFAEWADEHAPASRVRPWLAEATRVSHERASNTPVHLGEHFERLTEKRKNPQELCDAIRQRPSEGFEELVQELGQPSFVASRDELEMLTQEIAKHLPLSDRQRALECIRERVPDKFYLKKEALGLLLCLGEAWKQRDSLRLKTEEYIRELLPQFLSRYNPLMPEYGHQGLESCLQFLYGPQRGAWIKPLLDAVATALPSFSSESLSGVISSLVELLEPAECLGIVQHELCPTDGQAEEGPRFGEDEAFARFLWSSFNHPDSRVRWRALYAARRRCCLHGESFVSFLIVFLSRREGDYWMSAREWLLLFCVHLARCSPELILPHVEPLKNIAFDTDFPHVSHRGLAIRALRYIETARPGTLGEEALTRVNAILQPIACSLERQLSYHEVGAIVNWTDDLAFDFDETDTLRYWYPQLAECFGIRTKEIAERAAHWIVEKLGAKVERWDFAGYQIKGDDIYLSRNGHGAIPTIEPLHTYYERHGMLLVAGDLIAELPVIVPEHGGRGWDEWLGRWILDADESLPATRRPLPPLEAPFLQSPAVVNRSPDGNLLMDRLWCDAAAGLGVCLAADFSVTGDASTEYTFIQSSSICLDDLEAFLALLDKDAYSVGLPSRCWQGRCLPNQSGTDFVRFLAGTEIGGARHYPENLALFPAYVDLSVGGTVDRMDARWSESERKWYLPTAEFFGDTNAIVDLKSMTILDTNSQRVGEARNWCLGRPESRAREIESCGSALWLCPKILCQYLSKRRHALVGTVEVFSCATGRIEERPRPEKRRARAFALLPDGTFRISDNASTWTSRR